MKRVSKDDNFYFLLVALLALLFCSAVVQQLDIGGQKSVLALTIMCLAVSIMGVNRQQTLYRSWYGLLLVLASISGAFSFLDQFDLALVTLPALLFFLLSHTYNALKQVMLTDYVSKNQIVGSICVYLLLGVSWAFIYLIQLELFPNAFNGMEKKPWLDNMFEAIYFSFITLTTVGYGDISPALPIPRFFVFLESILGSFYLAIMVASLVSSRLNQSDQSRDVIVEQNNDEVEKNRDR
ncbi:potassium channel family protein [Photobacterium jeanii]|uniref:potassium channel family protein n=1 Tax=Photobacterium jeanii TaxID=858640 RepID=UPI0009FFD1D8|nr:potassium channel family protein [Photobacterium jeanii]PST91002.1 two pore domain potassium channel family protein [Photobacterium jeanii]